MIRRANRRGSRRRRLAFVATRLIPALALLATVGAAYPVVRGHTEPAFPALTSAREALESARRAGAGVWAPDELAAAEDAFRAASAEHRRQEVRFLPFRDFRAVRPAITDAERLGRAAATAALAHRKRADQESREAIVAAEGAIRAAAEFAEAMPLGRSERKSYQRARIALDEARTHRASRDFAEAMEAARRARGLALDVTRRAASTASRYRDPTLVRKWRQWIDETVTWSRRTGGMAMVVDKDGHRLAVYERGKLVKSYVIELGTNWTADKTRSGDAATPEGRYKVVEKKDRGRSIYYKALLIDYPNAEDRAAFARAKRRGEVPANATPGGLIEIHGEGGKGRDWTRGCVALPNDEMDEVFARAKVGTPVTIVGSDGDGGALGDLVERHENGTEKESR